MSWFIGLAIVFPLLIIVVFGLFFVVLLPKIWEKFPTAVVKQGTKNASYTGLIVVSIMGIVWLIVMFGVGQSVENSFFITSLICISVIIPWYLFWLLINIKKAGKVVLDIMAFPNRNISFIGIGIGLFLICLGVLIYLFKPTGKPSDLLPIALGLHQVVLHSVQGFGRLQIREKGFWIYGDFLSWDKIESLNWDYDGSKFFALKLVIKSKMPAFLRNGVLMVPINKKQPLENLLQLYLPHLAS